MHELENLGLTDLQIELKNTCREIGEKYILPVREQYDEKQHFPTDIAEKFAEAGLFGVFIPEEFGGLGGNTKDMVVTVEELCKYDAGIALALFGTALGTLPILLCANEEQKKKYLPRIAEGTIAAFALTEANAGSDAAGVRTTAREEEDCFVLNGTKQWITNGGEADIYTVCAMTDPSKGARGASFFIVEKGTPGFTFGKKENKMGIRASATRELIFDECRVPKENLIWGKGRGFFVAMKTLDASRPSVAAQALGIATGALNCAIKYSRERHQFGKPLCANQGYLFMLSDMAMKVEAARSLVYRCAEFMDSGAKDVSKISAMAKCYASDVAMSVTTDAVQALGGYGYMKEYPVEKMMRDAKITQIYEGANQIQRDIIGKALIKEAAAGEF